MNEVRNGEIEIANNKIPDDLIETKKAARIVKAHLASAYRWIQTGRLRGWRRCGRWFVSEAELHSLFVAAEKNERTPAAKMMRRQTQAAFTKRMMKEMGCRK